jgi:hypothetical protein
MMSTKKASPVIIGKTASALNDSWYKRSGTATDINHFLKQPPSKSVSFFKVYRKTRGGSAVMEQYWKTLDNGYMIFVDLGSMKMGIVQGMPSAAKFSSCSKKDFLSAQNKLIQALTR